MKSVTDKLNVLTNVLDVLTDLVRAKSWGGGGGQMPPAFPLAMLMPVALLSAVL